MSKREIEARDLAGPGGRSALLDREWPPCRMACPAHVDVRGYLELIARGRYRDALALILEDLPFPGVCGRICHHPCEQKCRRNDLDEPAAIRDLKRFVAEFEHEPPLRLEPFPATGEKVAVVGAGPSGLTAAFELARMGFRPTVFEKMDRAGGALARVIPAYRLPDRVLEKDIEYIRQRGVEIVLGVEVGKDVSLSELRERGFRAIVLALGLPVSRMLPLEGSGSEGVLGALDFLEAAKAGRDTGMGRDVVVVGGGNVAVDVARTAVRLGAERVRMVCLENEEEQPAWEWEVREAAEEGVSTLYRLGPNRIISEGGRVSGLEVKKVLSVFDEEGRFNPRYDEGSLSMVECDTVVFAVGQAADLAFLEGAGVRVDERGRLVFDPGTARTSAEDVFACGEVVTGPGSAVEAVANGKRTAKAVAAYLRGERIELDDALPPEVGAVPEDRRDAIPRASRAEMPVVPPEERKKDFREFELGFTEEVALAEAHRCMSCASGPFVIADKCAACLTCLRVCPFDVPVVKEIAEISSALCQGCGICAAECPAKALVMTGWDEEAFRREVAEAVASLPQKGPKLVVFLCCEHSPAARWGANGKRRPPGVAEVTLPDLSRLGVQDILSAFEAGADGLLLVPCRSGGSRYPGADARLRKRVEQAGRMLREVGLEPPRVFLREGIADNASAVAEAVEDAVGELAKNGKQPVGRPPALEGER